MSVIERFSNLIGGRGFREDTEAENRKQAEQAKQKEQARRLAYQQYQQKIKRQEAAEKVEEKKAKEVLGKAAYAAYKTTDVLRDIGQTAVRTGVMATRYPQESAVFDYSKSAGYKEVQKDIKKGGVTGRAARAAKVGIDVGEGVIRAVPGVPDASFSTETLKTRPGVAAGQVVGELATWRGIGKGLGKTIGSVGGLTRVAADPTKSKVIRVAAKTALPLATGTRKVITSRPVRYASEGFTGEIVDVGQAYFGQRREIGEAISAGKFKEAGARLAAGYAIEKAGDIQVSKGFRSAMPTTVVYDPKTGIAREAPDVDKFIGETGTDPKIARLFEIQEPNAGTFSKVSRATGIDFSRPRTDIDPRVLRGVKTFRGEPFRLEGVRVRSVKTTKGVKGERGERGEKQERTERSEKEEKLEKLERGERLDKAIKQGVVEPLGYPYGRFPRGPQRFANVKMPISKIKTLKVKNLAKLAGTGKKKDIRKLI